MPTGTYSFSTKPEDVEKANRHHKKCGAFSPTAWVYLTASLCATCRRLQNVKSTLNTRASKESIQVRHFIPLLYSAALTLCSQYTAWRKETPRWKREKIKTLARDGDKGRPTPGHILPVLPLGQRGYICTVLPLHFPQSGLFTHQPQFVISLRLCMPGNRAGDESKASDHHAAEAYPRGKRPQERPAGHQVDARWVLSLGGA
jgi:hypothetical protein